MAELDAQLATLPPVDRTTVVYAAGSGGTGAGLLVGAALTGAHDRGVRVAGVNVCDDRDYFVRAIGAICAELAAAWPGPGSAPSIVPNDIDIDIIDGYVGDGYALSRREELELIRDVARAEAIVLDPVYTGKAFYGLSCELARDPARFGNRVVFLHTGGIFGLFPKAGELAPLL
jgi:D-cysteine desulfhydrase